MPPSYWLRLYTHGPFTMYLELIKHTESSSSSAATLVFGICQRDELFYSSFRLICEYTNIEEQNINGHIR